MVPRAVTLVPAFNAPLVFSTHLDALRPLVSSQAPAFSADRTTQSAIFTETHAEALVPEIPFGTPFVALIPSIPCRALTRAVHVITVSAMLAFAVRCARQTMFPLWAGVFTMITIVTRQTYALAGDGVAAGYLTVNAR